MTTKRDVRNEVRAIIRTAKETNNFEPLKAAIEMLSGQESNKKAVELVEKMKKLIGEEVEVESKEGKWMQSNTGMWHLYGGTNEKDFSKCSNDPNRPNVLNGEAHELIPGETAKVCKKCLVHVAK